MSTLIIGGLAFAINDTTQYIFDQLAAMDIDERLNNYKFKRAEYCSCMLYENLIRRLLDELRPPLDEDIGRFEVAVHKSVELNDFYNVLKKLVKFQDGADLPVWEFLKLPRPGFDVIKVPAEILHSETPSDEEKKKYIELINKYEDGFKKDIDAFEHALNEMIDKMERLLLK